MNCPNCQSPTNPGDTFCGVCGAPLAAAPPPPPQQPAPQPDPYQQPMPQQGYAQPDPYQPQPQPDPTQQPQPGYPQPDPYQPQPPQSPKSKTALIITLVVVGLLLCGCVVAGAAFFLIPQFAKKAEPAQPTVETSTAEATESVAPEGTFPTAQDALSSVLPEGYVFELATDSPQQKEYWVGPPNSEFEAVVLVNASGDGWVVGETYPFNGTSEALSPGATAAADTVEKFLTAIKEERPRDAQKLTVNPFRSDPASAQFSDGQFSSFTINAVEDRGDGTYSVTVTEVWTFGAQDGTYTVVDTEQGPRINNLEVQP